MEATLRVLLHAERVQQLVVADVVRDDDAAGVVLVHHRSLRPLLFRRFG